MWASQSQEHGRCANVEFQGATIYSYGTHFPMARFVKPVGPLPRDLRADFESKHVVLITTDSYSTTTDKHMSYMRRALPDNVLRFEVSDMWDSEAGEHDQRGRIAPLLSVRSMVVAINEARATVLRARVNLAMRTEDVRDSARKLGTFLRVFRRELAPGYYAHREAKHTGMGNPVRLDSKGEPMNCHVGSPADWMREARKLVRTEGWPIDYERDAMASRIKREERRELDMRRAARNGQARTRATVGRPLASQLRDIYRTACPDDTTRADQIVNAGIQLPGLDRAGFYGGTLYGWGLATIFPARMAERWLALLRPVVEELKRREGAERARIQQLDAEERARLESVELAKWIKGEPTTLRHFHRVCARIEGTEVVTTHSARVPLEHARRLARLWKRNRDRVAGTRVGHFTVNRATDDGLVIGCHRIDAEETARLADLLCTEEG